MVAVALALVGPDSEIRSMAGGIESLTGLPAPDYPGTALWDHLHRDDRHRIRDRWQDLLDEEDGSRCNCRVRIASADGSWTWVTLAATRALGTEGLAHVVVSIEPFGAGETGAGDAFAPMVGGERAPADEAFLRTLLNLSADAVIVLDEELRIKWASAGAPIASGWSPEDFRRITPEELVHPDDMDRLVEAVAAWRRHSLDEPAAPVTIRLLHRDQGWRWTDVVGRDLRANPAVRGIALALSDADSRVRAEDAVARSERRNRALVRGAHERVLLTDAEGMITWVSEAASDAAEHWRERNYEGFRMGQALPDAERAQLDSLLEACLEQPGPSQRTEVLLPAPDGDKRWVEVTARNLLDDPDVAAVVWNFRDVHDRRVLLEELESASEVFKSLAVSSTTGLFEEDSELGCVDVNPRWEEITGMRASDAMGEGWQQMIDGDYAAGRRTLPTAEPGPEPARRLRIRRPDGELRWIDVRTTVAHLPGGAIRRFGGIEDATEAVEAEEERQRFLEIFDLTTDMVMIVGADGRLIFMNRAARRFHGLDHDTYEEVVGTTWPMERPRSPQFVEMLGTGTDFGRWTGQVDTVNAAGDHVNTMVELLVHRDDDGEVRYFTSVSRDITETKSMEATLEQQARHDDLTGLPNRKALLDDLEDLAAARADQQDAMVTALFIDLDHFKVINDSLGHEVGDRLLRCCAERIRSVVRPGEMVARFGGDEFVVLCTSSARSTDGEAMAERIDAALNAPCHIEGHEVHTTVSIGIATSPVAKLDPHGLIRDADTAMYHAKSAGRRRWATFDSNLRRLVVTRQQMEHGLRRALESDELSLEFQPVARLDDLLVVGAECLLRWTSHGVAIIPDKFIPVAEDTGLIGPIGCWVLSGALAELNRWDGSHELGARDNPVPLGIAVNVSVRQLQSPGLVRQFAEILDDSGLDPGRVTLEITETVLLEELTTTGDVLGDLKDLGVHIALDDFGTGYSPLTYLKDLPIDEVKLDRSFVAELGTDPSARAIASSVISLAEAMSLRVVAEGIETESERRVLRDLGCCFGQGSLISRPVVGEELPEAVHRIESPETWRRRN